MTNNGFWNKNSKNTTTTTTTTTPKQKCKLKNPCQNRKSNLQPLAAV